VSSGYFRLSAVLVASAGLTSSCVEDTPDLFPDPQTPMFDPSAAGGAAPGLPTLAGGGGSKPGTGTEPKPGAPGSSATPADAPSGALPIDAQEGAGPVDGTPVAPATPVTELDPTGGARLCPQPAAPLLLDFETVPNDPTQGLFGDFQNVLSGGTYFYPVRPATAPEDPTAFGLVSQVTGGSWSLTGTVREPAGFGVFLECQQLDASAFTGIAFTISGSFEGSADGVGEVLLVVGSAGNDVARSWFVQNGGSSAASFGRCFPVSEEFDGTCQAARFAVPVTAEPREVVVRFADLAGGSPEPSSNPAELTTLQWRLPSAEADAGIIPYSVDLVLDDIRFVAP
jgi:hypothetical protein